MASNSNFEPYAYLYDNGFFNPIEVIVDDNNIRKSAIVTTTLMYIQETP